MFIEGLSLGGFRSFSDDPQRMGPFSKMNLFAGQNNSGKSNILMFLHKFVPQIVRWNAGNQDDTVRFGDIDRHQGQSTGKFTFGLGHSLAGEKCNSIRARLDAKRDLTFLEEVLRSDTLSHQTGCIWIERSNATLSIHPYPDEQLAEKLVGEVNARLGTDARWNSLLARLVPGQFNDFWTVIRTFLKEIDPTSGKTPKIELIPAIRRVGERGTDSTDFSGIGIIERLAKLQNPDHRTHQHDKRRFATINEFLQRVTEEPSATLEIPYERDTILVHMNGKSLPLASIGTGIHEVVIIAAAATVLEDQIVCVEEPELHLHPLLQRKLLGYLNENTSNQYFIATHSAHFLDYPDATVFHVRLDEGATVVTLCRTPNDRANICADLGFRASDLFQSNAVIWVEGPSDRIYLNHWLSAVDTNLIEGVHYSIMFYGGRLLSHLTAIDPEVDEFISLRRLNRNLVVMMDSDKRNAKSNINPTKERICNEFNQGPGFAWVTHGREIENYVSPSILRQSVEKVVQGAGSDLRTGRFARTLVLPRRNSKNRILDKIKVANQVVSFSADLSRFDLEERMHQLAKFIRDANR